MNRPVTGLEREHFKVFDDRVEQTVTHFAMDDEAVAVGLVFDISGSMGPKLRLAREAAAQFFATANPEDEFFLVEFNDQPRLVTPLTSRREEIQNQLAFAQSKGRTALLDALALSLHEMKQLHKRRKALLIISDGGDNSSRYTEGEVRSRVRESDVLIYAIGIYEPFASRGRSAEEVGGTGASERPRGTNRRQPLSGRPGRAAGYRGQDRRGHAEPLRAGLLAHRSAAQRPLPPRGDQSGSAAGPSQAERALETGILRSGRVRPFETTHDAD